MDILELLEQVTLLNYQKAITDVFKYLEIERLKEEIKAFKEKHPDTIL